MLPDGSDVSPQPIVDARPIVVAAAEPPRELSPLELTPLSRAAARLDLALIVFVLLLVPFGMQLALSGVLGEASLLERVRASVLILPIEKWFDALLAAGLAAYLLVRGRLPASAIGLQRERAGRQALFAAGALAGVYAAMLLSGLLIALLWLIWPELQRDILRRTELLEVMPVESIARASLLMGAVAIHEELLFRGLLIPWLRRSGLSWAGAVGVSTATFALLHVTQGWLAVIQIFGVGLVLAITFVLSRSLSTVIVAHFLFNMLQLQLARVMGPYFRQVTQQ